MSENSEATKTLEKIFLSPGHAGSFTSAVSLQRILKHDYGFALSIKEIQKWLAKQRAYYMNKPSRQNFERNPIVAVYIDQQWQADLFFLPELAKFNQGISCFLVVIDVISRFAWVEPMKNKTGPECTKAFSVILSRASPRKPSKMQTDDGKEFFNKWFKKLLLQHDMLQHDFSTKSDMKAAIVERFNKTLKEKIYKYLSVNPNNNEFLQVLQPLVKSYNHTYHSSIGMAPQAVTNCTLGKVIWNLYGHLWKQDRQETFERFLVGEYVRISSRKHELAKRYKGNWTEEIFKIVQVKQSIPRKVYKLADLNGEQLSGSFYPEELQKAAYKNNEYWTVEAILDKKTLFKRNSKGKRIAYKRYLVKWYGYPDSFNSWVNENEIKKP